MYRRIPAIALSAAVLAVAGCGGDDEPASTPKAKPAGMPVQEYVADVGGLGQSINDARSGYFHADHTRAAIRRETIKVQAAYAAAVSGLATVDPPQVAADLHRRFEAAWRKRAAQLEKVVTTKPFNTARVDDLMAATGRDVSADELYTLPQ